MGNVGIGSIGSRADANVEWRRIRRDHKKRHNENKSLSYYYILTIALPIVLLSISKSGTRLPTLSTIPKTGSFTHYTLETLVQYKQLKLSGAAAPP